MFHLSSSALTPDSHLPYMELTMPTFGHLWHRLLDVFGGWASSNQDQAGSLGSPVEDLLAAGCWLLAGCWMLACIRLFSCRLSMSHSSHSSDTAPKCWDGEGGSSRSDAGKGLGSVGGPCQGHRPKSSTLGAFPQRCKVGHNSRGTGVHEKIDGPVWGLRGRQRMR